MAWTVRIKEVRTVALKNITVGFTLLLDSAAYVSDEVTFNAAEIEQAGQTDNEKKLYIKSKIDERAQQYIAIYTTANKVKSFEGTEYNL